MQPFPTAFGLPPVGLPIQMRPQIVPLMGLPPAPGPLPFMRFAAPPTARLGPILARPISAGPVLAQNTNPEKPITLYVGHLTSKVKDEFFKTLLSYCGSQRSWKRVTSSFGFVEFANPDGALRAMRVLGGRELFGKKLLINADKKTKEVLDQYTADVKAGKVQPMTHPGVVVRGKSGEEIMKSQDEVAESLILGLLGYEERSQALIAVEEESDAEEKPKKSHSLSKSRSRSAARGKVLPPGPSLHKRSSSRKRRRHSQSREHSKRSRSRSEKSSGRRSPRRHSSRDSRRSRRRSPSPVIQSSRDHRRRERDRSESPVSRPSRERRRERKKRKKHRRKRSDSSDTEKRKKHKETKIPRKPDELPEPDADDAPKSARELVGYIPKDQTKLLKYPIDWDLIDNNEVVEKVMRDWIDSRIKEYLGEEEADLTDFAVGLLANHIPPKEIISEMEVVLVEDSEGFVVKMWRRMIFESLKIKYNIS